MEDKGFVTIRLADSERLRLETLAKEAERTLSAEIRLAIRRHLTAAETVTKAVA